MYRLGPRVDGPRCSEAPRVSLSQKVVSPGQSLTEACPAPAGDVGETGVDWIEFQRCAVLSAGHHEAGRLVR